MSADRCEDLKLDTDFYAKTMAQTLAVLHWKACTDARDVEFVLGSSSAAYGDRNALLASEELQEVEPGTSTWKLMEDKNRACNLWLLNFNQVRDMKMTGIEADDTALLQNMVDAFLVNDPYYPRPLSAHKNDTRLWELFRGTYLATSEKIARFEEHLTGDRPLWQDYPTKFIDMLTRETQACKERKAAAQAATESDDDEGSDAGFDT